MKLEEKVCGSHLCPHWFEQKHRQFSSRTFSRMFVQQSASKHWDGISLWGRGQLCLPPRVIKINKVIKILLSLGQRLWSSLEIPSKYCSFPKSPSYSTERQSHCACHFSPLRIRITSVGIGTASGGDGHMKLRLPALNMTVLVSVLRIFCLQGFTKLCQANC